ncbi:DUF2634 domain-containing protein [Paenibacillus flagellatus]|uniref:DUF2634 domain-containing protein n=1 Tax=Paenibacillus flagellatus TaxID=2211139 RepID=A0A2V5K0D3_9BACL|nr:DUF2634 domain-containing protein [Paenibacillus flagellatus]PYI52551.1 DUF2634 domain-containing protein [Paenibacillus flagellatus]
MPNLFPITGGSPNPTPGTANESSGGGQVKFGRSWRFDYEAGDFVLTPTGTVATCTDADAWLEWCKKALCTERYTYLAYSRQYGHEFDELIPRNLTRQANELEIARIATETLKTDPRTSRVDGFSFTWEGERCYFQCEVTNVRGQKARMEGSVVTY